MTKLYSQVLLHNRLKSCSQILVKSIGAIGLLFGSTVAIAQPTYCPADHAVDCTGTSIDVVEIVGTTLNNAGTGCTGTSGLAWSTYPASGNTTATLQPGQTYTFNITTSHNSIISVWIDFNQDGNFDATEHTQVTTTSTANTVNTASITIPATATVGLTGMRVRDRLNGNPNGPGDACLSFGSGESEDYIVQIGIPVPCTGTPTAGTVTTNNATTCSGGTVKITASGMTAGGGIVYQFEESNDNGVTDPWAPVMGGTGANGSVYTTAPLTSGIYFRHKVTCSNTNLSATSPSVQITVSNSISAFPYTETFDNVTAPALPCGWTTLDVNGDGYQWAVETNNPSSAPNAIVYSYNFSSSADDWFFSPAFSLVSSSQYLVSFNYRVQSSNYPEKLAVYWGTSPDPTTMLAGTVIWRDTNLVNTTYVMSVPAGFTPPSTGTYYLGFRAYSDPNMWDIYVDDIMVTELAPCTGTPVTGTVTSSIGNVCANGVAVLTAVGATQASGVTYVWEESNDNGVNDPWATVSGGSGQGTTTYTTPTLTAGIYYRLQVTCSNSGQTAISQPVNISNTGLPCYCNTNLHTSNCSSTDNINSVSITNTSLSSLNTGCNGTAINPGYSITTSGTTLVRNTTYTINVTSSSSSTIELWIDLDRDGLFDANLNEWRLLSAASTPGTPATTSFTIPATAQLGQTGMRIRTINSTNFGQATPASACNEFSSGETEDYVVTIAAFSDAAQDMEASVSVVPNPTSGKLTLQLAEAMRTGTQLRIFDANGREVFTATANGSMNQELDLTSLANGLYVLQTVVKDMVITKRIAVQK
jgi:hypothetical protein